MYTDTSVVVVGTIIFILMLYFLLFRHALVAMKVKKKHKQMMFVMIDGMLQYDARLNSAVSMLKENCERMKADPVFVSGLKNTAKDIWEKRTPFSSYREFDEDDYISTTGTGQWVEVREYNYFSGKEETNFYQDIEYNLDPSYFKDSKRASKINPKAYRELLRYKRANDRLNQYLKDGIQLSDGRKIAPVNVFSSKGVSFLAKKEEELNQQILSMKKITEEFNSYVKRHPYGSLIPEGVDTSPIILDFYQD